MKATTNRYWRIKLLTPILLFLFSMPAIAEYEEDVEYVDEKEMVQEKQGNRKSKKWKRKSSGSYKYEEKKRRYYFSGEEPRIDAGKFHVAFAAGGNFYIEPKFDNTGTPIGEYFKNFGFQGGVYFDYDYGEGLRLGLRGFVGYKYLLESVHAFVGEGRVRYLFEMSENVRFGVDLGVSAGLWFRTVTDTSQTEETIFLPALIIGMGFDFNPLMVDFKTLINRIGEDSTLLGLELLVGIRL